MVRPMIATARTIRLILVPLLLSALILGCQGPGHRNREGGLESLEMAKNAFMESWT